MTIDRSSTMVTKRPTRHHESDAAKYAEEFKHYVHDNDTARRYIVRAFEITVLKGTPTIVMEQGLGDVRMLFYETNNAQYVKHAIYDTLKAIEFLQTLTPRICQRDVKMENIIAFKRGDDNYIFKLGDFGYASPEHTIENVYQVGSFISPRLFENLEYDDYSNDVYCLMISAITVVRGIDPTPFTVNEMKSGRISHYQNLIKSYKNKDFIDFIDKCCDVALEAMRTKPSFDYMLPMFDYGGLREDPVSYDETVEYICNQVHKLGVSSGGKRARSSQG